MATDWSRLGGVAPDALVKARSLAHHAAQWPTKAARANLAAVPDDSHSSLVWGAGLAAFLSQPLATKNGAIRIGVGIADLRLMIVRGSAAGASFALDGRSNAEAGTWIDAALRAEGLAPASVVKLPYEVPDHAVARGAQYGASGEAAALAELARWFGAAAEALDDVSARFRDLRPGPSPVLCWPHHFDIATVIELGAGQGESARSVGIGLSPGDEFYAQPYWYVSPSPKLDAASLPKAPLSGHWHTQGFLAAVATGADTLKLGDRRRELVAFIIEAVEIGRARLGA